MSRKKSRKSAGRLSWRRLLGGLLAACLLLLLTIAIRQGKNRQIRRMCAKCGYTVNSLKRVSEGDVKLGELPSGRWRYLTEAEVRYLKSL